MGHHESGAVRDQQIQPTRSTNPQPLVYFHMLCEVSDAFAFAKGGSIEISFGEDGSYGIPLDETRSAEIPSGESRSGGIRAECSLPHWPARENSPCTSNMKK